MTHLVRDIGLDGTLTVSVASKEEAFELQSLARHFPHILSCVVLGDDCFHRVYFSRFGMENYLRGNPIPDIHRPSN